MQSGLPLEQGMRKMAETIDHETGEILKDPKDSPTIPVEPRGALSRMAEAGDRWKTSTPYQSAECGQIAAAYAAAQGEMESPKRTKTGKVEGVSKSGGRYSYEYKYAPFEEVVRVLKASCSKHGLMYYQGLVSRGDQFYIRTKVCHVSGEWVASDYPVLADRAGPQGFAAATTYAKRYGLSLAFGVAAEDDDDGAAAQQAVPEAKPEARPSKAYPAVQQPDALAVREAAKAPYRRLKQAVEAGEPIHDGQFWLPGWAADAALVDAASPSALEELRLAGLPKSTQKPQEEVKAPRPPRRRGREESPPTASAEALAEAGYEEAQKGVAALAAWWATLSDAERDYLQPGYDRHLLPLAKKASPQSPGSEVPTPSPRSGGGAGPSDGSHPLSGSAPLPGDPPW
jgi:hypothetical protein